MFLNPIQNCVSAKSVHLEAAYLEASLLYLDLNVKAEFQILNGFYDRQTLTSALNVCAIKLD